MNQTQSFPIACELSDNEQKRCAELYSSGLFSHVVEVRERSGGYSLRFSWDPGRIVELGEFLVLDSSCCSFLDHSLDIPRGKQSIWLHLTGPDEAEDVLRKEIEQLLPVGLRLPNRGKPARASGFSWRTLGIPGVGLAAVLCCAAPAVGVAVLTTASAWFVDSWPAFGLIGGVGVLAWAYSRRRGRQKAKCCS